MSDNTNPTQAQRILEVLGDHEWHDAFEFLRMMIPRYGARLWELRDKGYPIQKRTLSKPGDDGRNHARDEWRLAPCFPCGQGGAAEFGPIMCVGCGRRDA